MKKSYSVTASYSKPTVFAIGTAIAVIVAALMLLLFAFFMTVVDIPKGYAFPLSSIAMGVGSFFGAGYSAKKLKEKGYLCGLVVGAILFLICTIVGVFVNGVQFTALTPLRAIISVLMGMIGGITAINSSSTRSLVK